MSAKEFFTSPKTWAATSIASGAIAVGSLSYVLTHDIENDDGVSFNQALILNGWEPTSYSLQKGAISNLSEANSDLAYRAPGSSCLEVIGTNFGCKPEDFPKLNDAEEHIAIAKGGLTEAGRHEEEVELIESVERALKKYEDPTVTDFSGLAPESVNAYRFRLDAVKQGLQAEIDQITEEANDDYKSPSTSMAGNVVLGGSVVGFLASLASGLAANAIHGDRKKARQIQDYNERQQAS